MSGVRRADTATRIAVVIRAIEADLPREWSGSRMGAVLGVSSSQLRRLFAEGIGATPRHLLCDLRLRAAARLLADPATRIKDIQALVGIADPSHFARDFRCRFGMSPSEFRFQLARANTTRLDE